MPSNINAELTSLSVRDPLAWSIMYVDLLEDKTWEVDTRKWMVEPFGKLNPWRIERYSQGEPRRMSIIKSTQAGISTMALSKGLHFAVNWSVRLGYTLPRQQDTLDFVTTRVDPIIASSPYLKSKLGVPDSAHAKRIGSSYLFFMEMSTEARMMPIDCLYVDEVDLSNPDNLASVLNRLDASRWKLNFFLSTPTVANYGIHALYSTSDGREWMVECPKCSYEQTLLWDANLRVVGRADKPDKVFYGCARCSAELGTEHIQTGRWVPQRPNLSGVHVGYHISQMMTSPAETLYHIFRDPQTNLVEFYRKRLGMPYEIGGGSLERDDFLAACFDQPYGVELEHDGKSVYYLGADQGNEIQVVVCKYEPNSRRGKIVHVELIPIQKGFDRLATLMSVFRVRRAVVDANPNRHEALRMTRLFPGRVLAADYVEQRETWKTKKGQGELKKVATGVTIDRTSGFDGLAKSIKDGEWALPGQPPGIPNQVELLIDHTTAIKRDVETRRTASGEIQVAVWRKLRAEHLAHAWLYMKTAKEVDRGKGHGVAVLGADRKEDEIPDGSPDVDRTAAITALLAEVPPAQLMEYVTKREAGVEYEIPFPLSYKLELAIEAHPQEDVLYIIKKLAANSPLT